MDFNGIGGAKLSGEYSREPVNTRVDGGTRLTVESLRKFVGSTWHQEIIP